jgi:predicted nucleotidyltransferase component of viral defense system
LNFSREFGLRPDIIEKDYVLGWLLNGISNNNQLNLNWLFKGGTCLKKCYFETYRFSEDLDFTIIDSSHINQEFLVENFIKIADWIYKESGIEMPHANINFELFENLRGKICVQGKISYRGPLNPHEPLPRIKIDLTTDEIVVLESTQREVQHPYPDRPESGININCYCFEEIFAEKIRALAERERPRDLYDVVHLYRYDGYKPDRIILLDTLKKKCDFKEIEVPTMEFLINKPERGELETEWANMLAHQVSVLPPFEQFWQVLPTVFDWLYRAVEKVVATPIPTMGETLDTTWLPPAMVQAWNQPVPLELIRFAAANRLCVNLTYNGSQRLIEPYSLRRTHIGNLLLYAVKHNTGEIRSYRVNRIQNIEVTKTMFIPRYVIELTTSGSVSTPVVHKTISRASRTEKSRTTYSNWGPKYIFQCPSCQKKFTHKTHDSNLKPHKDKFGNQCYGRFGIYIDTKY